MAKTKKTLEELNKKYGIKSSTTPNKNESGKRSESASSKSSKTTDNSQAKLEELNKKYGVGEYKGQKKSKPSAIKDAVSSVGKAFSNAGKSIKDEFVTNMVNTIAQNNAKRSAFRQASWKNPYLYNMVKSAEAAAEAKKPKDYASTKNLLRDEYGVTDFSQLMSESEWASHPMQHVISDSYQDYLEDMVEKYKKDRNMGVKKPMSREKWESENPNGDYDEYADEIRSTYWGENLSKRRTSSYEALRDYFDEQRDEHHNDVPELMTEKEWYALSDKPPITYQNYLKAVYEDYMNPSDASGWEVAGNAFMSGVAAADKGLAATLDLFLPTELLGEKYDFLSQWNDYTSEQVDAWSQELDDSLRGKGDFAKSAAWLIEQGTQMAPTVLAAVASGGTSTVPSLAGTASTAGTGITSTVSSWLKNPSYWMSIAQTTGTDYEEAKAAGADDLTATLTAIIKSGINAGIEVGGGLETLNDGDTDAIYKWVKSSLEEGNEELVQGLVSQSLDKIAFDHDKEIFSTTDENAIINPTRMAKEWGAGAALGGVFSGAQIGAGKAVNSIANKIQSKQQTTPATTKQTTQNPVRQTPDEIAKANGARTKKDGTVKRYYHGSNESFESFDLSKSKKGVHGFGVYLTTSQDFAKKFGDAKSFYVMSNRLATYNDSNITADQVAEFASRYNLDAETITKGTPAKNIAEWMELKKNDVRILEGIQDVVSHVRFDTQQMLSDMADVFGYDGIEISGETIVWNTDLIQSAESVTSNNIGAVEAQEATGFGLRGAEVVADYANTTGVDFSKAVQEVRPSYLAGYNNPDMNIKDAGRAFDSQAQIDAYTAGQIDAKNDEFAAQERAENARVFGDKSGLVENEHSKKYTPDQRKMADTIGKDLGAQVSFEEQLLIDTEAETKKRANAWHEDGEIKRSNTSKATFVADIVEESLHRMSQINTEEVKVLKREAYDFAVERAKAEGVPDGYLFGKEKAVHDNAGITHNTGGYIEEVAVGELAAELFADEKAWNKWRERLDSNSELRTAWQKLMDGVSKIIDKIKRLLKEGSFSKEARAKVNRDLANLERLRGLYTEAYKATRDVVQTKSSKNLDFKTNEEYNGNRNYSLYTDEVMFSAKYSDISQSPKMRELYDKAKKGNVESAYKLLSEIIQESVIDEIRSLGNDVHLMPVVGTEETSTNVLPSVIAKYVRVKTGQDVFEGIYKEDPTDSRKTKVWGRMKENYPSFKIGENTNIKPEDIDGKKFVLIDDNSTTGRTLVGLRNFIEENGGKVVGYYALTTGHDQSEKMITTDETWDKILSIGLDAVRDFAEEEGVKREISKLGLTEREAQELIEQFEGKKTDTRRRNEGATRSESSIGKIRTVYEEDVGRRTEKNNEVNFSLKSKDINKLPAEEKRAVEALGEGAEAITNENGDMLIATNKDKSTVMYSVTTHENGGKEALEMALIANGHTKAEIEQTLAWVDDAADYLKILAAGYAKSHNYTALSNHLVADVITNVKTGKQVISAIVNNGEYPVNIDLALICKKRVAYMNLMNRLIEDGIFDKVNYGGEAIAKVNDLLRADGFETACLGCFVESRRLQFQTWAETIVSEWNAEVDKRKNGAGSFNFADGKAKLTDAEMDALSEELKGAGKKNAQGNLNLGQGSVQTRMGRLLDKVPSLQKHLTVADLLTPNGLTALRAYDSNLFSLVKSRYGAASPKIVQDYNPYASEIAMMTFASVKNITSKAIKGADAYRRKVINEMGGNPVKQKGETTAQFKERKAEFTAKVEDEAMRRYLYDIGGARIQSFSDFMIENVFDYIQIFADLSAKRLPLHGYTKEIIALRLFGMTGAKWNGSWIAHVDRGMGKEYAGLLPASEAKNGNAILVHTEDGDYAIGFDDYARHKATNKESFIQSIGMKDMMALQLDPRYSPHVGSITIGVSDKQILAMLDSPYFRFVIPYHSSGMLPQFAKLVGVDLYNDYTDYQNTKVKQWYDAYGNPCAPVSDVDVDTSYNFNAEVQKTGDAKKAAENYLKWCEKKHPVYGKGRKLLGYVTFSPKFSDSPYGTDFTKHENYYKLLEDFNSYDNITEESSVQGAVTMNFPSEQNRLTAKEMEAYKERLRETGIFSDAEIEKYSEIANKTFKELIADEVKGRAEYQEAQAPKWENTVKNVEKMLLGEHKREFSLEDGISNEELRNAFADVKKGKKGATEKLAKYAESGVIPTEAYEELVEKYGAIPTGEKPFRDVQVPAKTAKNKKVSQTVRTILEAGATPDEAVPTIEKMVEDGVFSYEAYSDKEAISNAEGYIKKYGWSESYKDWMDAVNKGEVSKDTTTTGWVLYNNAANRAATETGDARKQAIQESLNILDAMVRHQRNAAQALQATRILKKLSPETQLYGVQKSVQAFQKELTDKYGKNAPDLVINEDLAEQFLTAKTEEERLEIEKELYRDIGRQMPADWLDKWNAWRYLAMLGNVRTHVRNVFGNAFFAPVINVKNIIATGIEGGIAYGAKKAGKDMNRRKAFLSSFSKQDRALITAAYADYANVADQVSNGGKYNDSAVANQQIEEGRRIFKFKPLEWARKGNSKALEAEDVWFSKPHYAYALAQYCKANNITAEQIAKGKAIAPAREYAIKEAQKATYKDTNAFSQFVSGLGRNGKNKSGVKKAVGVVVEGVLPFRKTPANILVRGVEYSPIGLLKGLTYDLYKVGKGEMSASEAIDNVSAGLTGTGLLALGVYLAAQGLIRGHGEDEEKERKFKEMQGHQGYSLELPNGQSITLDWLAPEALPFFVGANIWEKTNGTDEKVTMSSILQSIKQISAPMLEMSCLQGINDMIESVGFASSNDSSGLMEILSSATTSYLMQGIPTIFGQAERTGEEERMTTYTEKDDFLTSDMQYALGKASAKIPGWDYKQIPYIDAWGRKEASETALKRGLNNFLNPAYTSTVESSKMEEELLRLYDKTGEDGVFPERADKYFMIDGVRKDLTADEYVRYATLKGEKSYKMVSELTASKAYKKLTDKEKVEAVANAYDYANQKAKEAISRYKPQSWVDKADEFGADAENYVAFKTKVSSVREDNDNKITRQQVGDIITDMAKSDDEAWKMYLSMYDGEKDIQASKSGIELEDYATFKGAIDGLEGDGKRASIVDQIIDMDVNDDDAWTLYLTEYSNSGTEYAQSKGISGNDYMAFLDMLAQVDKPTESGKYGSYTQEEATAAINRLTGLSREEKANLWQSVNTKWKKNPFR